MGVVFIQKDEWFEISFIWSDDISTLKNLLTAFRDIGLSFGDEALGYYTEDFEAIYSTCNVVFDEIFVIENDVVNGDDFVNYCVRILNGQ